MEYKGNRITKRAWNWLDVNEATINIDSNSVNTNTDKDINISKADKFNISSKMEDTFSKLEYGISKDIVELNKDKLDKYIYLDGTKVAEAEEILSKDENIKIYPNSKIGALRFRISNVNNLMLDIDLEENVEAIYIIETEQVFNLVTRINLEKNSTLDLIILEREKLNDKKASKLESISIVAKDNAIANIVKIDFGEYDKYFNYTSDLIGENTNVDITLAYVLNKEEKYDMSFHQRHIAKNTNGNIIVEGILRDSAAKIFKGTIDFKKGSKGSVGNEYEGVTNYSKKTKSISLPILLAAEDEVKGNHASNHGKFDEEQIYYITSRGHTRTEAENIISESKIIPIIDKVKSKELKEELKNALKEKLGDGNE